MPTINIVVECEVERTIRLRQVASMFDMEPTTKPSEQWTFDISLPDKWQIGLIVGPSGSGKTTLAKHLFSNDPTDQYEWPENQSLLDGFPDRAGTTVKSITQALSSVGFSSPPSWLKPYRVLSTGEQFRANLARAVHGLRESPLTLVDEFTSTVDRTVARVGSAAVSRAVRRADGRFVAVTCHGDVEKWLCPDWVIEMPAGTLTQRRPVRRPRIDLDIRRVHHSRWITYRKHHYLSTSMAIAAAYAAKGLPYRSVTTHPAMISYRKSSPLWATTRKPSTPRPLHRKHHAGHNRMPQSAMNRLTATHQYIGPPNPAGCKLFGMEPS